MQSFLTSGRPSSRLKYRLLVVAATWNTARRNYSRVLERNHALNLIPHPLIFLKDDSRLPPSQWEMSLQSNAVSHWLGINLDSALFFVLCMCISIQYTSVRVFLTPWGYSKYKFLEDHCGPTPRLPCVFSYEFEFSIIDRRRIERNHGCHLKDRSKFC